MVYSGVISKLHVSPHDFLATGGSVVILVRAANVFVGVFDVLLCQGNRIAAALGCDMTGKGMSVAGPGSDRARMIGGYTHPYGIQLS